MMSSCPVVPSMDAEQGRRYPLLTGSFLYIVRLFSWLKSVTHLFLMLESSKFLGLAQPLLGSRLR
jgi:hypothetical protein